MKIDLPIKIHNRFDIEVKDVSTGEIVQRGYAENIVLNNYFASTAVHSDNSISYFGYKIHFGRGTGTLSADRTTLFNKIADMSVTAVEYVVNQAPLASYYTRKIVLSPSSYIGETITEVGIGPNSSNIMTHALIKDSEGNPLVLGPKTDTQEITIYATVYFQPNFEPGVTLYISSDDNGLIKGFTGRGTTNFRTAGGDSANIRVYAKVNGTLSLNGLIDFYFSNNGAGKMVSNGAGKRISTSDYNGKITEIQFKAYSGTAGHFVTLNLQTLAENASTIWSGHEFDNTPVGVGNGSKTVFDLTWNEVWMEKPKSVYVDGVLQNSGFTFNSGNITFDTAPADQAVITADYWVKYIPKDVNHIVDLNIEILYGEGTSL